MAFTGSFLWKLYIDSRMQNSIPQSLLGYSFIPILSDLAVVFVQVVRTNGDYNTRVVCSCIIRIFPGPDNDVFTYPISQVSMISISRRHLCDLTTYVVAAALAVASRPAPASQLHLRQFTKILTCYTTSFTARRMSSRSVCEFHWCNTSCTYACPTAFWCICRKFIDILDYRVRYTSWRFRPRNYSFECFWHTNIKWSYGLVSILVPVFSVLLDDVLVIRLFLTVRSSYWNSLKIITTSTVTRLKWFIRSAASAKYIPHARPRL